MSRSSPVHTLAAVLAEMPRLGYEERVGAEDRVRDAVGAVTKCETMAEMLDKLTTAARRPPEAETVGGREEAAAAQRRLLDAILITTLRTDSRPGAQSVADAIMELRRGLHQLALRPVDEAEAACGEQMACCALKELSAAIQIDDKTPAAVYRDALIRAVYYADEARRYDRIWLRKACAEAESALDNARE